MPLTVSLTPLPLLKRQGELLLRCIRIAVAADPVQEAEHALLTMRQAGASWKHDLGSLQPGQNEQTILIPEVPEESCMEVILNYGDQGWNGMIRLSPARRWTVHLVLHSHTDLGFTDPISTVARIHNDNTDRAIDLCHETAGWPEGIRFKWTCEVSWQIQQFIASRPPARVAELMKLIRDDSIAVGALYAGELTDIMGHEESVRSLYYAAFLRRRYGIPCDTAMLCDVPGCTAGFIQIMAKAGIQNFIIADNNFIAPFLARTDLPRPFWWNGADNTRLLCWYTDHPYYAYIEGEYYGLTTDVRTVAERLPEKLIALENAGYPFDRLQLQYAFDNVLLNTRPLEVVREWNTLWEYPKVRLSTARECLAHLRAAHAGQIPSRTGDWTNWWAGIATGFPSESALTRRCHEQTSAGELLWTAASLHNPSLQYPGSAFAKIYDGLLAFDEHSGGGALWNPKSAEEQDQAVHEGYGLIHDAARTLTGLESSLSTILGGMIDNRTGSELIAVVNPTGIARGGIAVCPAKGKNPLSVVDQTTGQIVQAAQLPDNSLAFHAADVPPYGYRVYRTDAASTSPDASEMKASVRVEQENIILENRNYRVVLDRQTGACVSLYATTAGQECVRPHATLNLPLVYISHPVKKIELGKYIPEIYLGVENPGETTPWPSASRAHVEWSEDSVLGASCRVSHMVAGKTWLTQEYRLPHEDAGVFVSNRLHRVIRSDDQLGHALAGFLDDRGLLYFAFPFNIPGGVFEYESPAAVLRPSVDQFKGSCHDFFAVQRWCRIAAPGLSLTVASPDAPLVDVGSVGLLKFKPALDHDQSSLYFRGVTLREWGNTIESPYSKGEDLVFRFGIDAVPLEGEAGRDMDTGRSRAHAFGAAMHLPLAAVNVPPHVHGSLPATYHSWCSVAPANVELMTLKRGEEDGVVVRIREILGEPAEARIAFPGFRIAAAEAAMITEEPCERVQIRENAIHARLAPFAIRTFLVTLTVDENNAQTS